MLFSIKNIHGKIGFVSKGSEMMTFDYKKEYKEFYMPKKSQYYNNTSNELSGSQRERKS